jgi:hypothetical protein
VDAAARLRGTAGHAKHGRAAARARGHAAQCTRDSFQFDPRRGAGQDVFDALVRQIDRIDQSYKN